MPGDRPVMSTLRDVFEQLFGPHEAAGIDTALREAEDLVAGWTFGDALRRLLGDMQHDVLCRPGAWVALEALVRVGSVLGGEAHFRLDGAVVATACFDARGEVRAVVRAPEPGTYRIEVAFGLGAPGGHAILQVVAQPVALVDGGLALRTPVAFAQVVRRLQAEGFAVACFDVSRREQRTPIREQIGRLGLAPMAVLTWDADAAHIEQLGFDLRQAFATLALRRHLAAGVPIALVVTDRQGGDLDGVPLLTAEEARLIELASFHAHALDRLARHRVCDPLRWRLDAVSGGRSVAGNVAHVELDNRRARERVFALIEGAQRFIHLQFYLVRPGAFAEALITRLVERARSGVVVRFMADALFSDQRVYTAILAATPNAEALTLTPIQSAADVNISHLKRRDHRKLLIVDGTVAIVSGRNAADEYYVGFDEVQVGEQTRHDDIPWLDAHVELTGPIVQAVQQTFAQTWAKHGGTALGATPPVPPEASFAPIAKQSERAAGLNARLVVHEGMVDLYGMATYEALLDGALDHVYIANDFPIVSILERAILRALARGVRVTLLTGSATARREDGTFFPAPLHRTLFEHLVKARLEPLIHAGARVYELATPTGPGLQGARVRPYLHAKIVSVDGQVCSVGSANLDAAASFWESEAIVLIEDSATATALEAELEAMVEGSFRLDVASDYWLRERLERAVVGKLWPNWFYS